MKTISVVIPVYNEEKGFKKFYSEMLEPELKKLKYNYEVILVNDGSRDKTLEIVQGMAEKDAHIKVLAFSRNFGKEVALTAGIREATGDAILTIDADGQQPPNLIPEFIEKWEQGGEIIIGVRGKYEKHGLIAKLGSKLFYKMLNGMGVKDTVPGSTDFRVIDRVVADEYNKLTEHGRITRGLMDWMGFKKVYIDYIYGNRLAGKPSYNFGKLFNLAIDSFISLSSQLHSRRLRRYRRIHPRRPNRPQMDRHYLRRYLYYFPCWPCPHFAGYHRALHFAYPCRSPGASALYYRSQKFQESKG